MPEQTQDLPELLREIAEVSEVVTIHDGLIGDMRIGDYGELPPPDDDLEFSKWSLAVIQAALQESIEERGWDWDVRSVKRGDSYDAFVDIHELSRTVNGSASEPATAIASAFNQALRAEQ